MHLKIIHSNFQINLVDTSFTMVEENNWFNDRYLSKYVYPFTKRLTDKEITELNYITEISASGVRKIFDVVFFVMEQEHEAVLEIRKIIGTTVEMEIRYGFEEFPNFSKKLAQLNLHKIDLGVETIYAHAENRIGLTYPATDYNFPRVFTDKFDTSTDQWQAFEGSINNYNGTVFLINEYDAINDVQLNRNIMQPFPYLLYVLKQGFADAGYTLLGDILTDPEFEFATLNIVSEFYSAITDGGKQEMLVRTDDYTTEPYPDWGTYSLTILLATPGKYKIAGNLFIRWRLQTSNGAQIGSETRFYVNGVVVASWRIWDSDNDEEEQFILLDINVEVLPGQADIELQFTSSQLNHDIVGGTRVDDAIILDATVTQLTSYNPDGSANPTLILPTEIDLTKCVPDKTFGDLFNAVRKTKNFGIEINGDFVVMNYIEPGILTDAKSLKEFEIKEPERISHQGDTYELRYQEVTSEIYEYASVLVTANGVQQSPYEKLPETKEIFIDAIPLPLTTRDSVRTAHGFIDDNTKIQWVLYTGLQGGMNLAADPSGLLIPNLYQAHYEEWINFLLNHETFIWTFNSNYLDIYDLKIKSTIFAYGKYHIIKILSRRNLTEEIIQTEIETASLE